MGKGGKLIDIPIKIKKGLRKNGKKSALFWDLGNPELGLGIPGSPRIWDLGAPKESHLGSFPINSKINGFGLSSALIPAGIPGISRCGNIPGIHSYSHFSCSPNPSRGILWDGDLPEPLDLGFVLSRCWDEIFLEPLDLGIFFLPRYWDREQLDNGMCPAQILGFDPSPPPGSGNQSRCWDPPPDVDLGVLSIP